GVSLALPRLLYRQHTWVDENADGHRHFVLVNQVIEHHGHTPASLLVHETGAILKHHQAGRRTLVVFRGHIDPVIAHRAGEHFARPAIFRDCAFGNSGLTLRIGTERVLLGP